MTHRTPAREAEIDQKLARLLGELLSFAAQFDQEPSLLKACEQLRNDFIHSPVPRNNLAEAAALLALTLHRERRDRATGHTINPQPSTTAPADIEEGSRDNHTS